MNLQAAQKYSELDIDSYIRPTVDYLMNLKFPSGNYPSSFESRERDRLVHWCHGAPGFTYMFAAAYEVCMRENAQSARAIMSTYAIYSNR